MNGEDSDFGVQRSGRDIVLANKDIRLQLIHRDGGYAHEFYGVDRTAHARLVLSTIHRDLIPFTEHRTLADPAFSGHRQHLFEFSRESVRLGFTDAKVTETKEFLSVRLSGGNAEARFSSTITLYPDSKFVRVSVEADFQPSRRPHVLEYLMSTYVFMPDGMLLDRYSRPDYSWTPCLRPEDDHIVAERSFSSAAVFAQYKKLAAAIIPEPARTGAPPLALDLDMRNGLISAPILACGFCDSEPDGHFSRHDCGMVFRPSPGMISYTFWIFIDADAKSKAGFEPVQDFLWDLARPRILHRTEPMPRAALPESLPTAYVLRASGAPEHERRADAIINRVLSTQSPDGPFDLGYNDEPGCYDTARGSQVCRWLLAIHHDFGGDLRILAACRSFADFLVGVQSTTGAIPIWFKRDLEAAPELRDSVQTAAAGRYLAGLYAATGDRRYLSAAVKAMKFVTNPAARNRYIDRDTYLAGVLDIKDYHTCIYPQGSSAMRHVADLAIAIYRLTGDERSLKTGLSGLSQMCWLQDTWSDNPGGFTPGNAFDGQADHAAFGRTLLEYHQITHKPEHIERGIAALRAGIALGDPEAGGVQCWAMNLFGSALIDVRARAAHIIGPCRIDGLSFRPGSISFDVRNGGNPCLNVRFSGLRGRSYKISINGQVKHYSKVELESGINVVSSCE